MSVLAVLRSGAYVELPDPAYTTYASVSNELSKADRNTLGDMIKERIALKASIQVEWHGLTKAQKDLIMSLTSGNTFQMRYLDIEDDTVKLSRFYRGSDTEIKAYGRFNGTSWRYYDIKTSLVEL